jgi:hypothetical protein
MNAMDLSSIELFASLSSGECAEVARLADDLGIAPGELGDSEHNASLTATSSMRVVVLTDRGFRLLSRVSPRVAAEVRAGCRPRDCPLGDAGSAAA